MLFIAADESWTPGSPLAVPETGDGLHRTRRGADAIRHGRPLLAVSACYDPRRGMIVAASKACGGQQRAWTAPAAPGPGGTITTPAAIPGFLVRAVGPCRLRTDPGHAAVRRPPASGSAAHAGPGDR